MSASRAADLLMVLIRHPFTIRIIVFGGVAFGTVFLGDTERVVRWGDLTTFQWFRIIIAASVGTGNALLALADKTAGVVAGTKTDTKIVDENKNTSSSSLVP